MSSPAKATLEELLRHLEFDVVVEEQPLEDGLLLEIKTEDSGRLIGRQGQTLSSLQYILNRILFQQDQSAPKVMVDVGNYRMAAREELLKRAQAAAEKVRRWNDVVELEPMNAFDRRVVHNAFKTDPAVETHSVEVDGTDMKVVLLRPRR